MGVGFAVDFLWIYGDFFFMAFGGFPVGLRSGCLVVYGGCLQWVC